MAESAKPRAASSRGRSRRRTGILENTVTRYGVVGAWIAVIVVFSVLRPDTFASWANVRTILGSQAVLLVLALALVITLAAGELDFSFAGTMSVSLVLVGYLNVREHWPIGLAILVAVAAGVLVGSLNAVLVVVFGVESIIVTLGMGTLLGGLGVGINAEITTGISPGLIKATSTTFLDLPMVFWYALILVVVVWYVFELTPLGRYMRFTSVSPEVARLSGIRVDAIRAGALITTSTLAALAGVLLAGSLGSSDPDISTSYLLPAASAAFLGSTTIAPGRFNAWGTFVATYFLITGITGLELLGLSGWVTDVFYGASLVLAVTLSRIVTKYTAGMRDRRQENTPVPVAEEAARPVAAVKH